MQRVDPHRQQGDQVMAGVIRFRFARGSGALGGRRHLGAGNGGAGRIQDDARKTARGLTIQRRRDTKTHKYEHTPNFFHSPLRHFPHVRRRTNLRCHGTFAKIKLSQCRSR